MEQDLSGELPSQTVTLRQVRQTADCTCYRLRLAAIPRITDARTNAGTRAAHGERRQRQSLCHGEACALRLPPPLLLTRFRISTSAACPHTQLWQRNANLALCCWRS